MIRISVSIAIRTLAITLLVFACALAQEPAPTLHGTWIARDGRARILHGTWTGGALPHHPDSAEGTWTLTSNGQMVLAGTWRAEKSRRGWEGRWFGHTARGGSLAGTWGADLEHWSGKTLRDMLELTLQKQVSGWWTAGRDQGNWWLKGSPARTR